MSYRIHYQSPGGVWRKKASVIRLPLLIVLCFLLFLMLVNTFWPEGAAYISRRTSIPKESAAVVALDQFAEDLFRGEPLSVAFSEFCDGFRP